MGLAKEGASMNQQDEFQATHLDCGKPAPSNRRTDLSRAGCPATVCPGSRRSLPPANWWIVHQGYQDRMATNYQPTPSVEENCTPSQSIQPEQFPCRCSFG